MKKVYLGFLKKIYADKVPHAKERVLLDHLIGTYDMLNEWELPPYVCTAGLFHSVYGNEHFTKKLMKIADRDVLKEMIGEKAELLVYYFNICSRKATVNEAKNRSNKILDKNLHAICTLSEREFSYLSLLFFANELEQIGEFHHSSDKEKTEVQELYNCLKCYLNKDAIEAYNNYIS